MFRSIMTWGSSSRSSRASGSAGINEDARQVNESLYELYRPDSAALRIIFFHGLQPGNYSDAHLSTWQSEDGCCFWPQKWLVEDFPGAHVLSVSYNGGLRKGSDARVDMFIIGENLLSDLLQESIEGHWHCPVILVGHSIGGLVIKELCCRAHAKLTSSQGPEKAKLESFLKNIRGIFYYATPHRGSHAADKLAELIPSPMLKFFKTLNEDTARLNSYFEDICEVHYKWRLAGLGEILPTNLGPIEELVVPEASARSKDFNLVEGADHYSICRPSSKIVRSFSKLKYFLRRIDSSTAGDPYLPRIKPQTLAPLPFGPDPKYVPISHSILEAVEKALENVEGSRVVTVYGEPGMGKSCLVKYVALLYEEQRKQLTHSSPDKIASFPDGVQYLFCGQRANERIKELTLKLLQGLEFGAGSAPPPHDPTAATGVQEWNYQPTDQIQLKLRSCLAKKKVLIILDDLWEEEVLPELLFGDKGVKYLVASQRKEIWSDAEKIYLEKPHITEARRLMANYTTGLPKQGEFSENIQTVMDDIMKALEYHPLSLANVGMSIIGSRATDTNHWRAMEEDLRALLDDDTLEKYPRCYDRPYNLTVGASMMLMVECVPAETLQLLYLIALLEVPVSERILKFFYQSIKTTKFDYRYSVQLKDLEERSVIELTMREAKQILTTHGLRIHYIREKRYRELRSLAAKIVGERTGSLFVIMAAMHFAQPFLDLVTIQLEDHIRVITNGVIPRKMESGRDASPLVTQVRRHSHWIRPLFGILNLGGISDWEHQVRDCATRIILNFICNEELDNNSLTSLQARLPETTSTIQTGRFRDKSAVCAFGAAVLEIACDRRRAFSADVPPEKSVLLDWVWQSLSQGRLLSTVDQRIVDYDKYWMEVALKVGLLCAHPDPLGRPSMQSVLHMLAGDVSVPSIAAFYPARFSSELEIFSYGILHDPKSGGVSKLGEKPRKFSYKQLSVATRAFSTETQIGRGGFGSVHHGVLPSSRIPIAVKNMEIRASQHETEFMAELSIISQLRHPNLIKLEGWCKDASRGKQLLVYELMPNGSLDKALFETGESKIGCLSWPQRFNIVTGIAGALHYLHHGWKHQIIHRDIKSSNILLDKEWNAKLGDFGLARLVDHQTIPRNTMVIGTYGYIAPEAIYGTFTEKTDVFAFGAVLLEIACGRRAFSSGVPVEEAVLVNWVWQSVSEGALLRTVDKRLRVYDMHWMEVLLMVGLLCSYPDPAARPSMVMVSRRRLSESILVTLLVQSQGFNNKNTETLWEPGSDFPIFFWRVCLNYPFICSMQI